MKAQDFPEIATSPSLPGEEEVFRGDILDRFAGKTVLQLFKDMTSPGVRLQATDAGDGFLVWTAFITHSLYSFAGMKRTGPRQVLLAEFQRLDFFSGVVTEQYILEFEDKLDALRFEEVIKGLRNNLRTE